MHPSQNQGKIELPPPIEVELWIVVTHASTSPHIHYLRSTARGLWLLSALILLAGLLLDSTDGEHVHLRGWSTAVLPEACWSKQWFGWNCPLCGTTRSVILLTRGRWQESWQRHPAGILTLMTALLTASLASLAAHFQITSPQWTIFFVQVLWISLFVMFVVRHGCRTFFGAQSPAKSAPAHAPLEPIR